MVAKHFTEKPFDEATLTKLDIFESYLKGWLPVFLQSGYHQQVTICDFFAGSGMDVAGNPGSPLRILRTIAEKEMSDMITKSGKKVHIVLNDLKKQKELKDMIASERESIEHLENFVQIDCYGMQFQSLFFSIYNQLLCQPNLIFIDQCGIKEITRDIFLKLIELDKTDFLFFMSSSSLRRFPDAECFEPFWEDLDRNNIRDGRPEHVHRVVLDYIRKWIPEGNKTKIYPFSLKKAKESGGNYYGLVFGSKHPLGVEKFLKIAWAINETNGEANYPIDKEAESNQMSFFHQRKEDIFEKDLIDFIFEKGIVTNRVVLNFALENGHIPAHAKKVVEKLRKEGRIVCDSKIGISCSTCYRKEPSIKTIKVVKNGEFKD